MATMARDDRDRSLNEEVLEAASQALAVAGQVLQESRRSAELLHEMAERLLSASERIRAPEGRHVPGARGAARGEPEPLDALLERAVAHAVQASEPLAILRLEVDPLERIHELFGRYVGERTLARIADSLSERVRTHDVVAPYGDHELVVMLAGTSEEEGRWIAERLRKTVRAVEPEDGADAGPFTASVGVAVAPACGGSAAELLEAASAALAEARRDGWDRVVVAAPALPAVVAAGNGAALGSLQ